MYAVCCHNPFPLDCIQPLVSTCWKTASLNCAQPWTAVDHSTMLLVIAKDEVPHDYCNGDDSDRPRTSGSCQILRSIARDAAYRADHLE